MNIGLYNLEPNIVNVAMMKVSTYHKSLGDHVEKYNHLTTYDKIYAFSIFDFTDKSYVTKDMICGGSGFDITKKLPPEIDKCDYDWSLFPDCNYSIVWFSKGCIRNCKWCIVPKCEGMISSIKPKNLNPHGKYIKVMDNNFFANKDWKDAIAYLKDKNQQVDFQGIDVRLLTKDMCVALNSLSHYKQIKIAWDDPSIDLIPKITKVTQWIRPYKLMCYVLIGFNSTKEQDIFRVESLRKLKIDPFIMPFIKDDQYQKSYARYVNNKFVFNKCSWEDYKYR